MTLSYSVEYLTCKIFCESVLGVSHMPYTKDIAHFGPKSDSKSRWSLSKEKQHEAHRRFHVASNFCSKHKNPAIWLFLR